MEPIVIARAPLSISLGGGEPSLPGELGLHSQSIIRAAVDCYTYTIITPSSADGVQIVWAACPCVSQCGRVKDFMLESALLLPEVISRHFNVRDGLTVFLAPQIPLGGGMGVAGSLAVSMIKAVAYCSGIDLEPGEVAELACQVAPESFDTPTANIDPYAAAYGGLNNILLDVERMKVEPLRLSQEAQQTLESSMLFFRTDGRPSSLSHLNVDLPSERWSDAFVRQRSSSEALDMLTTLKRGDLAQLGELLHRLWVADSKRPGRVEDPFLDHCYWTARDLGALGGWGETMADRRFLALVCEEGVQADVTEAIEALGLSRWPLRLGSDGVEILEAIPRTWASFALNRFPPASSPL